MTRIAIDLSDLFDWYGSHEHVTGIQRVVLEVFSQSSVFDVGNVDFICRAKAGLNFYMVDKEIIFNLANSEKSGEAIKRIRKLNKDLIRKEQTSAVLRAAARKPFAMLPHIIGRLVKPVVVRRLIREHLSARHLEPYNFSKGQTVVVPGAFWTLGDSANYFHQIQRQFDLKIVTFVHDILPLTHPHFFEDNAVQVFDAEVTRFLAMSKSFIVFSHYVESELAAYLKLKGLVNKAIYFMNFGVGLRQHENPDADWETFAIKELELSDKEFAICVGSLEPRKNPRILLRAWKALYKKYGESVPTLVFVGRRGWKIDWFFDELLACNYLNNRVRVLHNVDDQQLSLLYKKSKFVLFPSFVEGRGLPVEEALAYGKYVLASNAPSVLEAGRNLAFHFDPLDEQPLIEEVSKVISDEKYLKNKEQNIAKNVPALEKEFTWQRSAEQIRGFIDS